MEPNTLYITISLPQLPPYYPLPPDIYLPYLTPAFDPKTYETAIASGQGREEFKWGILWIDSTARWTLHYTLDIAPPHAEYANAMRCTYGPPSVPRFDPSMIGMIKVLHLPGDVEHEMHNYLSWLTSRVGETVTRTFIWATTTYARCRKHVVGGMAGDENDESENFDINGFLEEALSWAYVEVPHALMGRGEVPVWTSKYGVELVDDEGEDDEGYRSELQFQDDGECEEGEWTDEETDDFDVAWPRLVDACRA